MLVHLDDTPQDPMIIMKMGVPIGVTEYHVRSAVRAVFVRGVEITAEIGLNPKGVEIVSARLQTPGRRWTFTRVECHLRDAVGYKILKGVVSVTQVQIIGIRLVGVFAVRALERVEAFRLRDIERAQDQPIYHTEHDRVGADGHRPCQNGADRKGWRLAQLPQRITEILK